MRPFHLPDMHLGGAEANPQPNQLPFPNLPSLPGQFPLPTQEVLNAHLTNLGQQPGGHFGGLFGMGLPTPNLGIPQQGGEAGPRPHGFGHPSSFQQILAQQQQARAAAGQQGISGQDGNQTLPSSLSAGARESERAGNNTISQTVAGGQNTNTTIHEGQGPNGSQWRVVINESSGPIPFLNNLGNLVDGTYNSSQPPQQGHQVNPTIGDNPMVTTGLRPSLDSTLSNNVFGPSTNGAFASLHLSTLVDERLAALENTLNNGGIPSEHDVWLLQVNVHELMRQQPWLQGRPEYPLITRFLNASIRASTVRRRVGNQTMQQNMGTSTTPSVTNTERFISSTNSSMVYLLSSPNGPHALLVSPSGMYATPGFNNASPLHNHSQAMAHYTRSLQQQLSQPPLTNFANAANTGPANPPPERQIIQPQYEQQQQPNEARDIFRIIFPLGGHLWLLLRLFGFVYIFTAGWRRIILLILCTMMVFIAQTGVFTPLQQAIWDPFRRHVEGLVPLGAEGRPADANRNALDDQRRADGQPNPREMADRLMRERDGQQGGSIIRRNLRRVERATALFIASLVPGVGERHIAARDAVRRAEEEEHTRHMATAEEEARRRAEDISAATETQARDTEESTRVNSGNDIFADARESAGIEHSPSQEQGQGQESQHRHPDQSEQPPVEI